MARIESDREDLLAEATALVERAELQVGGFEAAVVVGFRRDGAASIFIGAEPVFQFNARNQFRRGFYQGRLIKAVDGRLAAMRRERTESETVLLRTDLSVAESAEIVLAARQDLEKLLQALATGDYSLVGQVPVEADVTRRIENWLRDILGSEIEIATVPNVK